MWQHRMRTRFLACTLGTALTFGLLVGCASTDGATTEDAGGPADLTFWMTGGNDDTAIMQKAADAYHKSHPDTTVKVQAITWDDGHAKVLAAATSRSGPDIISGGMSWGIEFGAKGGMHDLRKFGADELKSKIAPNLWKSISSRDGSLYGTPLDVTTFQLYYRPDLLAKAGVDEPPATWQELDDAAAKLKKAGLKHPMTVTSGNVASDWQGYFSTLKQAGGSFYEADCTKAAVDSAEGLSALKYYSGLFHKNGAPIGEYDEIAALAKGSTAMVIANQNRLLTLDATQPSLKGKWKVAPLPAGKAGLGSLVGGRIVGVMSYTKYPKASADFVNWLSSTEAIKLLSKEAAAKNLVWIPAVTDAIGSLGLPQDQASTLEATLTHAEGPPNCPGWETSQDTLTKQLQAAVVSGEDPQKSLSTAAEVMNDNLK